MIYKKIPNSEIKVSDICLGTMTFGQQNSESEAHEQMEFALDNGVNFFDTAEMYPVPGREATQGLTEKYIGTWFSKSHKRDQIVLATKITGPSPTFKYISSDLSFTRTRVLEAVDNSLKRLQTDYIDLYQLHWPERKTNTFGQLGFTFNPEDQWKDNISDVTLILDELVKSGKIRHWGLSNETPWGVMRYNFSCKENNTNQFVSIQNPYNLLNRAFEVGLAEMSLRSDFGLLAYSPMGFGLLSGKYHKNLDTPMSRRNQFPTMARYNSPESFEATRRYLSLAEKNGLSLAQMALAFVNSRPFVLSNIIGATDLAQLEENIRSIDIQLSNDILQEIDLIHKSISNPAP